LQNRDCIRDAESRCPEFNADFGLFKIIESVLTNILRYYIFHYKLTESEPDPRIRPGNYSGTERT
jgi:hypothetical protein